jgi:hypothetical protein
MHPVMAYRFSHNEPKTSPALRGAFLMLRDDGRGMWLCLGNFIVKNEENHIYTRG